MCIPINFGIAKIDCLLSLSLIKYHLLVMVIAAFTVQVHRGISLGATAA